VKRTALEISADSSQAATVITLTEHVRQYMGDDKVHRIEIEQKMTGGFNGGEDEHILDGTERSSESVIYGTYMKSSEWSDLSDVADEWLREGWLHDQNEESGPNGEMHIKIIGTHLTLGWTTTVVWGFIELDGQRYHARKAVCRKDDTEERSRGVYSWIE
jgi:hypothetical protein